ncbi:MAG: hypothetical protein JXA61_02710 [Bacteroidales bacterium]|nr:hypothetical protein [Bacteroidales bacterium]
MITKRLELALILLLQLVVPHIKGQTDSPVNLTDEGNLKQGYWERKYSNDAIMYQGYFKDDMPVGEMKRYNANGTLQAILDYSEGGERVSARLFYGNGSIAASGMYDHILKDSVWNYYSYYDNTLVLRESYTKGKRNGPMLYYYSSGAVSETIEWQNDMKHGPWVQYFMDGSVKLKASYINDLLEEDFLTNYQNGMPYVTGTYLNDQRHGLWTFYNEDGTVDMELNYVNGTCLDEEKIVDQQIEFFRMIDENEGKFNEPDENEFLMPEGR